MMAPIRPEKPPTMCTTPEPAKSIMPVDWVLALDLTKSMPVAAPQGERKPLPHPQCTTTG